MDNKVVIRSLAYKFLERIGYQGIAFVVQIILARLLTPSEYGIISMLMVFVNISQVFVQSGLNTALIQKQEADETDFSSVFYISLGISITFYILLFICAPFIAAFYNMPELKKVLRVLAIILIPGAYNSIQNAKIAREMKFKELMYSTVGAVVVSGIVGIFMALKGYGVWSLVGQQISHQIASCIFLMKFVKWIPSLHFSIDKVRTLFAFGWKLLCSNLIGRIYENLQSLVIGKKYNSSILGYYNRGKQFPQLIVDNINGSIQSIMLPTLSRYQNDKIKIKAMMRRAMVTSSLFVFPMMAGLMVISKPLVSLILTEKWLACVPYIWLSCIDYAFMPVHTANLQAINAQGRSDIFLKLEIIKKIYGLIILCITVFAFKSPFAIAAGSAISTLISTFVNAQPNKKLLNYTYREQITDILPSIVFSLIMALIIYPISLIKMPSILLIIIQVICGMLIYFLLNWLFKVEAFMYIWDLRKNILKR